MNVKHGIHTTNIINYIAIISNTTFTFSNSKMTICLALFTSSVPMYHAIELRAWEQVSTNYTDNNINNN
ncbi:hypothetical protein Cantr_03356 [Candida viswanathii]|uniref:Uncharacterized protein n=1 Tax=Candida viswanathii TaxID=5486 RepID=A0A367YL99_9ASCO|nr:hypothetical protein Cantr_03356 [Candida viswanathii]